MTSIDNGQFRELSASELTSVDGGLLQGAVWFFVGWAMTTALDGMDDGVTWEQLTGMKR
jgi:hypothetical protein